MPLGDPALHLTVQLALGLLFAAAARHKLGDRERFAAILAGYQLLPNAWTRGVATAVPILEIALAIGLIVDRSGSAGLVAAAVLAAYAVAITVNLVRGRRDIACGCGAPAEDERLDEWLVARNAGLAAAALLGAGPATLRPWQWFDAVTVGGAVASLATIYVAIETARGNARRIAATARRAS